MLSTYKYKIFQFTQKCFNISLWEIVAQSFANATNFADDYAKKNMRLVVAPTHYTWLMDKS